MCDSATPLLTFVISYTALLTIHPQTDLQLDPVTQTSNFNILIAPSTIILFCLSQSADSFLTTSGASIALLNRADGTRLSHITFDIHISGKLFFYPRFYTDVAC